MPPLVIPYFEAPNLGPIQPWGLFVASGAVLAIVLGSRRTKRAGLDPDALARAAGWILLGGFLGARIGHVFFYHWGDYKDDLPSILRIWEGGLSSFGGFVGATLAGIGYMRLVAMPFWTYADVLCFAFAPGWALGRVGCFVIHDHPGRVSDFVLAAEMQVVPLGSVVPIIQARHDLGLYDGFLALGITLFFFASDRGPRRPGFFLGWLCILYAIPRFFLDFLRATDLTMSDTRYLGLTPAQYGSIILVLLGGWILWLRPHDALARSSS